MPASVEPSASASPSAPPSAAPTKKPSGREVATRIVVPALNIDLPVVRGNNGYPYCNVAMYLWTDKKASDDAFGQPGEGRVTYVYAHARDGMFGPIYDLAIKKKTPNKMLGMIVQVFTNYNRRYLYEIRQVRLHVTSLDAAIARTREEVWLQTSEGPKGTKGKTQVLDEVPVGLGLDAAGVAAEAETGPLRLSSPASPSGARRARCALARAGPGSPDLARTVPRRVTIHRVRARHGCAAPAVEQQ